MSGPEGLTFTQLDVVELMKRSSSIEEWHRNVDLVRLMFGGELPPFWHAAITGSGLAQRKEREWQLGRLQSAMEAAGPLLPAAFLRDLPGIKSADVIVAPAGDPLATARGALEACRRAMKQLDVDPSVWITACGCELATIFGAEFYTKHRGDWDRFLADLLRGIQADAHDLRRKQRARANLPPD